MLREALELYFEDSPVPEVDANAKLVSADVPVPALTKLPIASGVQVAASRQVVRALERDGFVQLGTKGSHCKLHHHERH
jgi:hypothetical protein